MQCVPTTNNRVWNPGGVSPVNDPLSHSPTLDIQRSRPSGAPQRQYVLALSGHMGIGIGDGTKPMLIPRDILQVEDLTGTGSHDPLSG